MCFIDIGNQDIRKVMLKLVRFKKNYLSYQKNIKLSFPYTCTATSHHDLKLFYYVFLAFTQKFIYPYKFYFFLRLFVGLFQNQLHSLKLLFAYIVYDSV